MAKGIVVLAKLAVEKTQHATGADDGVRVLQFLRQGVGLVGLYQRLHIPVQPALVPGAQQQRVDCPFLGLQGTGTGFHQCNVLQGVLRTIGYLVPGGGNQTVEFLRRGRYIGISAHWLASFFSVDQTWPSQSQAQTTEHASVHLSFRNYFVILSWGIDNFKRFFCIASNENNGKPPPALFARGGFVGYLE